MKEKRYVVMSDDKYLMYVPKGQRYEFTDDFKKASKAADKTAVNLMKTMYLKDHKDDDIDLVTRTVIVTYEFED